MINITDLPTTHSKPELVDEFLPRIIWIKPPQKGHLPSFRTKTGRYTCAEDGSNAQIIVDSYIESRREHYTHLLPPEFEWGPDKYYVARATYQGMDFVVGETDEDYEEYDPKRPYFGESNDISWAGHSRATIDEAKADCYAALVRYIADLHGPGND